MWWVGGWVVGGGKKGGGWVEWWECGVEREGGWVSMVLGVLLLLVWGRSRGW